MLPGMAGRVQARQISDDEGNRLKQIVRRGSGPVVTWRRAQMVLWPAQGMSVPQIAGLACTSEDRVRDVLHNFNAGGFDSLYPRYAGGRPPVFTLAQRREIKKIAKSAPAGHGLPSSRWSLAKLAGFLVAEGVVEDISHEGLRALLRAEGVSFQAVKTWKASTDPEYAAKKARVEHPHAIAGGEVTPEPGGPQVISCVDEFGPLNPQPRPGRQRASRGGTARDPGEGPRRRLRAAYHRTGGARHLLAAVELGTDTMYGHIKKRKRRGEFPQSCRYMRSLHPPRVPIAIICDNFSPPLTTRKDKRAGQRAAASNTEIACTPANCSWMNRLECQFTALREFTLNGTDHATHREQGSMIRRYIAWRNRHASDPRLRPIVRRANVAGRGTSEAPPRTARGDGFRWRAGAGGFILAIRNWLREWSWPHVWCELTRSRPATCWTGTRCWRSTAWTGST
jgi:transposase